MNIFYDNKDDGWGRGATRRSRMVAKEESGSVGGGERNPMLLVVGCLCCRRGAHFDEDNNDKG